MARCGIQYFPLAVVQPIPLELYDPLGLSPVGRGNRGGGIGDNGERGKSASSSKSRRLSGGIYAVDGELVLDEGDGTPEARRRRKSSIMRLGMISFDDDQGGDGKANDRGGVIDAENEDVNNRVEGGGVQKDGIDAVQDAGQGFMTLDVAGGGGGGESGLFPPITSLSLDTNALRSLPEADRWGRMMQIYEAGNSGSRGEEEEEEIDR